jgi:hypothetical protein
LLKRHQLKSASAKLACKRARFVTGRAGYGFRRISFEKPRLMRYASAARANWH